MPPFDWGLLLDAARAGACRSAGLEALRAAASALVELRSVLEEVLGAELTDLARAYRAILLDAEWNDILDLQLKSCPHSDAAGSSSFSSLDDDGELVVDATRCPSASLR